MELKVVFLLALATVAFAAPAKKMESEDMMTSEQRGIHSYAAPPASTRYVGGGVVTSYNRRGGSYSQAGHLDRPSIYGSSYGAPAPVAAAPAYHSSPAGYAPVQRYPAPELAHASHGYGPQRNSYSELSRHASQDPHYDPAKDPVSQYADHIPVFDYSPKSRGSGNELGIYGYRK